jgi:2-polyprenyl-6-methoxyphenol hydroxylase-like FAD-dependent oxidoreductase
MTAVRNALVIGGGIGGPATAMALRKAGIGATVCEAYETYADGLGGMLMIAPNGLNALDIIGAADVVRETGIPAPRMVMQSGNGKILAAVDTLPGLPVSQLVMRPELYRGLLDEAARQGVRIEHGKRLVSASQDADGVVAQFSDGSTATGDILIGADGIRSTVREIIDPEAPRPRYVGLLGLGGWAYDTCLASTNGAMHFAFGKRAFFGYQVLDDGRAGWFANLPRRETLSGADARAIPAEQWLAEMKQLFAGDKFPALRILEQARPEDLINTGGMEDIPTVPTWSKGRMVLVGDSAHATSPSSGQGASMAVESGVQLARCLRDLPHHTDAFAAYESLRRARVERVIAAAARTNSDKAAGPVARVFRDLLFPIMMRTAFTPEKMFGWQHRYQIDWDAPVTAELPVAA